MKPKGKPRGASAWPQLDAGPLVRYVVAHAALPDDVASGIAGWQYPPGWARRGSDGSHYRTYYRAKERGHLSVYAADALACSLGVHPAVIWGDDWWDHDAMADTA